MTAKKKTNKKETLSPFDQFDPLHQVAFWGLVLLLFVPPYFRGLFFAPEQEKALLLATLVFWLTFLWRWLQNDHKFLRGPLDYFALALPLVYIISAFAAVNKGLAIDEVVKNVLYFLTFWSASRLIRHQEDIYKLLHVIYISALGVALAGLATATELVLIKDGFLNGRIFSTFQYPNALASYLGAVVLIGLYLWYRSQNQAEDLEIKGPQPGKTTLPGWLGRAAIQGYLYAWGNFVLLAVLFGTKSRGGLLVFGLVFLIYLVGLGARGRLAITLHTAFNAIVAYICVHKFILQALDKQYSQAWVWIFIGLVATLAGQLVFQLINRYSLSQRASSDKKLNLAFGLTAGLGALATGIFLHGRVELWEKVTNFGYLRNAFARMDFVHDALKMIKEKPLLGWGGGGWQEAYRSFQDYFYNSNEVHSYYFQVGVETGLLGLAVVLGIYLSFIYYIFRLYQKRKTDQVIFQTAWVLAAAFMVIAGHALIDFDLSLAALALVLWAMLGIVGHMADKEKERAGKKLAPVQMLNKVPLVLASLAAILILVPALLLAQSHSHAKQAQLYFNLGQSEPGIGHLESAAALNPFNPDFRVALSQVYRATSESEKSLDQAQRAVELSSYNAQRRVNLAETYIATEQYQEAVAQAEKAVELAPFMRKRYEDLAEKYFEAGYGLLDKGQGEEARGYLERAVLLPGEIETFMNALPEHYQKMWTGGPRLTTTPTIMFSAGAAKYQLGDYGGALENLQYAFEKGDKITQGKALIWLALVADKQGQSAKVAEFLKQAGDLVKDAKETFEHVRGMPVY